MLRTESLSKRYGTYQAVSDLTLAVPPDSIFGLVGPNGAGKTTTLRMLAGLLAPTAGQAWVDGAAVTADPRAVRRRVGYMPDFFGVYDDLKVSEYLEFYAACYDVPQQERPRLISDLLELVDLGHRRDAYVDTLSRGMKQRLCLARTLVHDPRLLLLDEPASGLDPRARMEMRDLLKELQRIGKTIVISSHILPELAEMCTHVAIMDCGRLMAADRVETILSQAEGAGTLELQVLAEAERALAVLLSHPGVQAAGAAGDGLLTAAFGGNDQDLAALLQRLVQDGVPVVSFRRTAGRLEEVFLRVTNGGMQ